MTYRLNTEELSRQTKTNISQYIWSTLFLISNFRHVLNAVYFLLSNSLVSEFYMPTFQNTLSVPSSQAGTYEDGTDRAFSNVGI